MEVRDGIMDQTKATGCVFYPRLNWYHRTRLSDYVALVVHRGVKIKRSVPPNIAWKTNWISGS